MTATDIQPPLETNISRDPAGILMTLIVTLLAPMFLGVAAGDIGLARMAAAETISAYQARNHADLIAIAQIVAFGLAALGSLSLSLVDDISLSMVLRLRGNANALNRSAEQNRRSMTKVPINNSISYRTARATVAEDERDPGLRVKDGAEQEMTAEIRAGVQTAEQSSHQIAALPPTTTAARATVSAVPGKRDQAMWAIAMVKRSGEISAGIPNLPPAERAAASMQAAALSGTAHELLNGAITPSFGPDARSGINRPELSTNQRPP